MRPGFDNFVSFVFVSTVTEFMAIATELIIEPSRYGIDSVGGRNNKAGLRTFSRELRGLRTRSSADTLRHRFRCFRQRSW